MGQVDHRKRRASLFSEMDQRVGLDVADQGAHRIGVTHIHPAPGDGPAGQTLPEADPLRHALDRDQALRVTLAVPLTADKAVDADDVMPGLGQVHRRRPAQVPVDAQYGYRLLSHTGATLAPRDERAVRAESWAVPMPAQAVLGSPN